MAFAAANNYVVLKHDLDFGAILAATHGEKPSVAQLRADDVSPDVTGAPVASALHQMADELEASFAGYTFAMTSNDLDQLARARAQWRWRGTDRPAFADIPAQRQISVWDFPRPPELVSDGREIVVRWGEFEVARTRAAWAVRETAHPPTFYLPLADVQRSLLRPAGDGSFCEWKGPARYWDLVDGERRLARVAWSYPQPLAGAEPLAECIAFYAHDLDCTVGGVKVLAQPGGFYGGWITPELTGPFKGEPGSGGW